MSPKYMTFIQEKNLSRDEQVVPVDLKISRKRAVKYNVHNNDKRKMRKMKRKC